LQRLEATEERKVLEECGAPSADELPVPSPPPAAKRESKQAVGTVCAQRKLCQQAKKHFPVFTDDTRKILAVDDLRN
jgi:hypothetical protein